MLIAAENMGTRRPEFPLPSLCSMCNDESIRALSRVVYALQLQLSRLGSFISSVPPVLERCNFVGEVLFVVPQRVSSSEGVFRDRSVDNAAISSAAAFETPCLDYCLNYCVDAEKAAAEWQILAGIVKHFLVQALEIPPVS